MSNETNLVADLARYGELATTARSEPVNDDVYNARLALAFSCEEILHSFTHAMQLITVMQEALKFYADEAIYGDAAINALSQAAKMGVE